MDYNLNTPFILEQLEKNSRKQVRYARLQCIFAAAAALCCLILLVMVARIVPQIRDLAEQVNSIGTQAQTVLTNLEQVTTQLADADLAGMVENVDALAVSSQTGIEQALEKINAIDIEALNKAIKNLADVVSPLADLLNRWG